MRRGVDARQDFSRVSPGFGGRVLYARWPADANLDRGKSPAFTAWRKSRTLSASIYRYPPCMDIEDLLPALQQQDRQAFAQLVHTYHHKLLALASSIVGSAQAEEVLQEAWMSAWRALPKFEGRSALKTWLTRIVINSANSRHRQNKPELSLDAFAEDNPGFWERFHPEDGHWSKMPGEWHSDNPDELLEQAELGRCLEKTLATLPDMQQTVFVLRHVQDMELDEICNVLEISSSNVRVLLHRARLRLFQTVDHFQETGEC